MLRFVHRSLAGAALALSIVAALPAAAVELEGTGLTLSLTPSISTDYLFRGISQTRNRGAVQGTADLAHESGVYVGAFASNANFVGTNARQEVDYLAGYRKEVAGVSLDVGGIYYTYPAHDRPAGLTLNWFEFAGKAAYTPVDPVKVAAAFFYSPMFQLESGDAYYVEGGVELKLPLDLTLAGRGGYQWVSRNIRYGVPDYANWSVGLSRDVFGFLVTVGYFDTDIRKRECGGSLKVCDARAMVIVSRTF